MKPRFLDLIAKKRDGFNHTAEELTAIANAAAQAQVPDYQLSAWLMAVVCRGMNEAETIALTRAMAASGQSLRLGHLQRPMVDKHSTGGVGDGISLALAPLAAACGLAVPMMSGRGLGHTGGTLDKLESIPGFSVKRTIPEIRRQMRTVGACLFGQTATLAPADRVLYALRDSTGTVGNQSLIISSILSKKMAEGLDALVLDVKVGRGAIFPDVSSARHLAEGLVSTARGVGLRTTAVLTAMDQPLGFYVGNSLEVRQALEVLQGDENAKDYVECLLTLGGVMLQLGRCVKSVEQGMALMHARMKDRSGLKIFRRLVKAQGGDVRVVDEPDRLVERRQTHNIRSAHGGFLSVLDARRVGRAAVLTGAGRENKDQPIDPHAGIILRKKVGDPVGTGEVLATLYASDRQRLKSAEQEFLSGVQVNKTRPRRAPTVISILRGV